MIADYTTGPLTTREVLALSAALIGKRIDFDVVFFETGKVEILYDPNQNPIVQEELLAILSNQEYMIGGH